MSNKKVTRKKQLFKRTRANHTRMKNRKLLNYLESELGSSTIHGIPYIVDDKIHFIEKLFWTLNFIGSATLVVILLTAQYNRFIESPTVMSVEMDYFDWNISFPAITLCPVIKVDVPSFDAVLKEVQLQTDLKLHGYVWTIAGIGLESFQFLNLNFSEESTGMISPRDYSHLAALLFRKFNNDSLTTSTNSSISVEAVMTEMGMCHVINSNVAAYDNPLKWSTRSTPYVKNNIELSVYDGDFLVQLINYADVFRMFVHNPNELVLVTTSANIIDIKGFLSIGLAVWSSRISETLRPTPIQLRKCRFINEPLNKRYPVYSYNHCIIECRINMIKTLCNCIPHFYRPMDHERICTLVELKCVMQFKREIVSLSTSNETLKKFRYHHGLPRSSRDCACLSDCDTDIYRKDLESFVPEGSISMLSIGISEFPKVRVVRDIIFSYHDIILRIGGVVNLCLGTSVISIAEIIVAVIKYPFYIILKLFLHI